LKVPVSSSSMWQHTFFTISTVCRQCARVPAWSTSLYSAGVQGVLPAYAIPANCYPELSKGTHTLLHCPR
jgi:hypothetical protein